MRDVKMHLYPELFSGKERTLAQEGAIKASVFRFDSGVCALRLKNAKGEMVFLPFQGQQIWSARFCGRDLGMKTVFAQPFPTRDFLATYGGFLLHCGATAMGVPSAADSHPLHGELPNMPYEKAYLRMGEDANGRFAAVGGAAYHRVGFSVFYSAEPEVKLHENATAAEIAMTLTNLRAKAMEYMYLCHINFRPVDGSRLAYSAPSLPSHVKVHRDIPAGIPDAQRKALAAYMARVAADPALHDRIDPATQTYDPEIVFAIRYLSGADGWAHSLQALPEGDAFYVAHRPGQLPVGVRWISRTGDEDALGLCLPATGEHKGYAYAKEHGQLGVIPAGGRAVFHMRAGYLDPDQAGKTAREIGAILEKAGY